MPLRHDVGFLAGLAAALAAAKLFGELAARRGHPAVLGELLGGVALGLLPFFDPRDPSLSLLAEAGAVLLLFKTGLECDLDRLLEKGPVSLAVACVGVALPFLLGWGLMTALGQGGLRAVFVGAALTATSVGITARVLSDLGRLESPEAQIILGAAVIDDILGLVILSAVRGAARAGGASWLGVGRSAAMALAFLAAASWAGPRVAEAVAGLGRRGRTAGAPAAAALCFAFALACLAQALGLAPIVGAFAAGALLSRAAPKALDEAVGPAADLFIPLFFVTVGASVRLTADRRVLVLTALLAAAAVLGKVLSGWAARGKGVDRLGVGLGMIPRGEVGLIFAQAGLAIGALDMPLYAAVVGMVAVTTFLAPLLLERRFSR